MGWCSNSTQARMENNQVVKTKRTNLMPGRRRFVMDNNSGEKQFRKVTIPLRSVPKPYFPLCSRWFSIFGPPTFFLQFEKFPSPIPHRSSNSVQEEQGECQEDFENENKSMEGCCDGRRKGPTARRFIIKTPQRPAALVPAAQPLGRSKTTAIVSAGSRGGRGGRRCRSGRARGRA